MSSPTFLSGDGVALHPFAADDYEYCRDLLDDASVRKGLSIRWPQTAEDQREFRTEDASTISFVIRADDGRANDGRSDGGRTGDERADEDRSPADRDDTGPDRRVGVLDLVHLSHDAGTVEIGYFLEPDAWGEGYATAATECAVEYAFDELRLHKVYARVFAFNDASCRVLEKAGFEREAVLPEQVYLDGQYVDEIRYGLIENDS